MTKLYYRDMYFYFVCVVEFGPDDYALFKGKVVEFRMTKRTVVFGRSTACNTVDFDLSLEGPAFKVSRRQVGDVGGEAEILKAL